MTIYIINNGADTKHATLAAGSGGSSVGYMTVRDSDATAASDVGAGKFRVRMTSVTSSAETYVLYRLS